jgi:predicted RNA-binding protein YlqC (UPF0109 family)
MIELVKHIVSSLADDQESISVTEGENNTIRIVVAKKDIGKIIGHQGRIAKAIRTVVKSAGQKQGNRYFIDIAEPLEA